MKLFHKYFFSVAGVASVSLITSLPTHATPVPGRNPQRQGPNVVSPSSNGGQMRGQARSEVDVQQPSQLSQENQPLRERVRVQERARLEQQLTKNEVQQVQQRLSERLNTQLVVDGVMGARTRAALRQYQQENNLLVTGRPDPETLESLGIKE